MRGRVIISPVFPDLLPSCTRCLFLQQDVKHSINKPYKNAALGHDKHFLAEFVLKSQIIGVLWSEQGAVTCTPVITFNVAISMQPVK